MKGGGRGKAEGEGGRKRRKREGRAGRGKGVSKETLRVTKLTVQRPVGVEKIPRTGFYSCLLKTINFLW